MLIVSFGSDTYGRVKRVGKTSVVTKFAMLQFMPVFPLGSFFYARRGNAGNDLVSLFYGIDATAARAIPLARIDWLSVAMAYYRGACGALALIGSLSLIPAIMHLSGERPDRFAVIFTQVLVACLVVGTTAGAASYCLPWQVGSRKKSIRRACGEVLGMHVDPASFQQVFAREFEVLFRNAIAGDRMQAAAEEVESRERLDLILALIAARLEISLGGSLPANEQRTDELLEEIRRTKGASEQ